MVRFGGSAEIYRVAGEKTNEAFNEGTTSDFFSFFKIRINLLDCLCEAVCLYALFHNGRSVFEDGAIRPT